MSSSDRELLELASKAAGYEIEWVGTFGCHYRCEKGASRVQWCPLVDDGDALRLAVKLQLSVHNEHVACGQAYCTDLSDIDFEPVDSGSSESFVIEEDYAATRLAIVRAAAEIGRSMP